MNYLAAIEPETKLIALICAPFLVMIFATIVRMAIDKNLKRLKPLLDGLLCYIFSLIMIVGGRRSIAIDPSDRIHFFFVTYVCFPFAMIAFLVGTVLLILALFRDRRDFV